MSDEQRDPNEMMDEVLDTLTPTYDDGQPMGPLDQFAHLATNTDVPPEMVLTRLHRRMVKHQ